MIAYFRVKPRVDCIELYTSNMSSIPHCQEQEEAMPRDSVRSDDGGQEQGVFSATMLTSIGPHSSKAAPLVNILFIDRHLRLVLLIAITLLIWLVYTAVVDASLVLRI